MKKLLLTLAALPAATMAVEASAQTNMHSDGAMGIQTRIANLEARLNAGAQARVFTQQEYANLSSQLRNLRNLERQYSANGLTTAERRQLQNRIRVLRDDLRMAGGNGWANRYGWTDRDLEMGAYGNAYGSDYGNGYGNAYGNAYGNSNVRTDQYGRPVDQYGRVIATTGYRTDQYGRTIDQYGRVVSNGSVTYDQYGRPFRTAAITVRVAPMSRSIPRAAATVASATCWAACLAVSSAAAAVSAACWAASSAAAASASAT
jgi:hypothetical protein